MRREITGEMANGRSINTSSSCLRRNSNFAMHHAAQTPKRRLAGTAIVAAVRVSRSAARAAGLISRYRTRDPVAGRSERLVAL